MIELHQFPVSQHSRRVVALLEEANIDYRSLPVDLASGQHHSPEFLKLNPNHQVPVLVDGALVLTESNAILRYLCAKFELSEWYPVEPVARARVDRWLDWNQCRLSPSVVGIVLNEVFMGEAGDSRASARGRAALPELMSILDGGLTDDFISGPAPTIADLSIVSNLTHLEYAGLKPTTEKLVTWRDRVCALPGFARAMPPKLD